MLSAPNEVAFMLVPLFITLIIALFAICISVNATDEIVQLTAVLTTLLCLFFSLIFASMVVKLLIVVALLISSKRRVNNHYERQV
jgi:hypothetical protein